MQFKKVIASAAAAVVLSVPAFAAPQDDGSFSALQGVEAQALSAQEMQAITGQLNAYNIAAGLFAKAETLLANGHPVLAQIALNQANRYLTDAEVINARYAKFGVLTACTSNLCP